MKKPLPLYDPNVDYAMLPRFMLLPNENLKVGGHIHCVPFCGKVPPTNKTQWKPSSVSGFILLVVMGPV